MDKAIKILEKYVEWIALSLGGLFLLWMIWSYLITPRVTVEIPGEGVVTPGEIDEKIVEGPVQKLQAAMNNPRVPEMKMTDYSVALVNTLKGPQTVAALVPNPMNTVTQPGIKVEGPGEGPVTPGGVAVVEQLPQPLPPPETLGVHSGRSLVQIPIMDANVQPGQPAPVENVDKDWVSVFYRISTKPIADLFRKHAIPDVLYQTTVLDIDLVRQEMKPDGTWGNDVTLIEPLPMHNVPPFPAANNRAHQHSYQQWAEANQATLLQPSFYQWIEGNQWVPLQAVGAEQPAQPEGERPLTAEERRQQYYERTQKQREERQPRQPTPRRTPSRRGGNEGEFAPSPGPTGGGYRAPLDGERLAQNTPRRGQVPGPRRLAPPDFDPGMVPQDVDDLGPGAGMPAPAQQPPMAGAAPLPQGQFDPNTAPPIEGWAHDDTIEPGKTYRYRVVYRLRNPMFGQINRVKDQKMAEQFDLVSDASEWSEPVSIPAKTQFFVAGVNHIKNVARFDVFNWQTGKWQKLTEEYGPGDLIGAKNNDDGFANGWSVVDIRRDSTGEFQVIVVDPSGNMHVRDSRTDRNNPEYRRLQQEIAQANVEPMAGGR